MQSFIDKLSQFPHRWSGSDNNIRALELIRETFNSYGFKTRLESLHVPGTLFTRIILSIILLFFIFFFLHDFYLLSLVVYSFILLSLWGELNFSLNLLGIFLPGHKTYNLEARLNSNIKNQKNVIVIAHHDSPKTGLLYHIADWLAPKQARLPGPFNRMFFLPFLAAILLGFIILIRPIGIPGWITITITVFSILVMSVILLILLNMLFSKKSQGANDNGSGVLVLMELARRFSENNPENIPITLLSTGAEEVGLTGVKNYIKNHPELDKENTLCINLECLGGGVLHWATGEHYFRKVDYAKRNVELIQEMENNKIIPKLPKIPLISPTDASPLANNGFNVVTLIGLNQGVVPSNYHRIDDTFDKLDQASLFKAADLIETVIRNLN
jgi:hypothetical protein